LKIIRVKGIVTGKVQGVFYRATAKSMADDLDLSGWIKNNSDGSVEFECQGLEEPIQDFLNWAESGPEWCRVSSLIREDIGLKEELEFEIIR
jgi:acylphosphatase